LGNDTDVDLSDAKTVVAVDGEAMAVGTQIALPSGALLTVQSDGSYTYDPNGKYDFLASGSTAADAFAYTMEDSQGATSAAVVTITIEGANDAPTAASDTATIGEDGALDVAAPGVLANDTDADAGDTKAVAAVNDQTADIGTLVVLPSGARLRMQADGSFRYDPNGRFESLRAGQTAGDSFTYTMADRQGATSSAAMTI